MLLLLLFFCFYVLLALYLLVTQKIPKYLVISKSMSSTKEEEKQQPKTGHLLKSELQAQIIRIFQLQEDRVHVWSEFDVKFKAYCLTAPQFDLKKLQLICKQISDKMNAISLQVIAVKTIFSSEVLDAKRAYELVERLQLNEKAKFETVCFFFVN